MADEAIWDALDPDPLLVRRDTASKLRYIAVQVHELQHSPYLMEALTRQIHEIALELDTTKEPGDSLSKATGAARKALQDLRAALPHIGREVDLAIKLSREYQAVRRALGFAEKAVAKEHARYESTVKEAKRQAARADAAEAKLAELRGEQS